MRVCQGSWILLVGLGCRSGFRGQPVTGMAVTVFRIRNCSVISARCSHAVSMWRRRRWKRGETPPTSLFHWEPDDGVNCQPGGGQEGCTSREWLSSDAMAGVLGDLSGSGRSEMRRSVFLLIFQVRDWCGRPVRCPGQPGACSLAGGRLAWCRLAGIGLPDGGCVAPSGGGVRFRRALTVPPSPSVPLVSTPGPGRMVVVPHHVDDMRRWGLRRSMRTGSCLDSAARRVSAVLKEETGTRRRPGQATARAGVFVNALRRSRRCLVPPTTSDVTARRRTPPGLLHSGAGRVRRRG